MKKKKNFTLGFSLIFHSFLSYLLYAATASTGLNVIVPLFANENGLDQGAVLSMNTVGVLFSSFFVLISGKLILAKGIRFTTTVCAIGAGVFGFVLMGFVHTLVGFAICTLFIQGLVYGYSYTSTTTLTANWWPRKKGIVMGITTTGIESAAFTLVPLMSFISKNYGYFPTIWFLASILIMFGAVSWFWIRDRPEEVGLFPDNIPLTEEEYHDEYHKELSSKESQKLWNMKEIFNKKYSWLIMISYGIFTMIASGIASTTIPFAIESGFSENAALTVLSIACFSSIIGSIISGYCDTFFGPKKTTIYSGIWILLAFLVLILVSGQIGTYLFLVMVFVTMGATGNLLASLIADIYGRNNFTQVFRMLYTGVYIIRGFTFVILGVGSDLLGSYKAVYLILGVLSLFATLILLPVKYKLQYSK
ncbi:MFS transporter [Enterococcus faecalis]|uniref:MFS transporter n=1 Tax=Enterococcus faecalis TaxID=1351 RepID=UPI001A0DA472|nr:MFS transporter [Enterococcus faecalis]EGO8510058.1 MFS transporter [Enterococcus faecalis]EGO8996530.1 MFS transporter [Enterococcus faecalis]EGQ7428081.1 MFS transporter [Enterococcus faecalis]